MHDNHIYTIPLMAGKLIPAGETHYGPDINIHAFNPNGNFSAHIELDAASVGTATVHYECTNVEASGDEGRYIKPSASADIFTAFAKNGGAGADGRDLKDFNVETCHQFRIGVTAVGGNVVIKKIIVALQ